MGLNVLLCIYNLMVMSYVVVFWTSHPREVRSVEAAKHLGLIISKLCLAQYIPPEFSAIKSKLYII